MSLAMLETRQENEVKRKFQYITVTNIETIKWGRTAVTATAYNILKSNFFHFFHSFPKLQIHKSDGEHWPDGN